MTSLDPASASERVLVLMPSARDGERTAALLRGVDVESVLCTSTAELCREVEAGAGAVLTTEEVILGDSSGQLAETMRAQPAWSAVPVLVMAREVATEHIQRATSEALKSLLIVERPVRTRTLLSVVLSALRSRRNQYEIRDAILDRERQASVLRAEQEKLRFAQAAGGLGAWELDLASRVLECSTLCRAAFGRAPHEPFSYQDLLVAVHPDDRARMQAAVAHTIETGDDYDIEYRAVWPNGQVRWLLVRGQAAHDRSGRAVRMAGITLDITERKRMVEELQQSQSELALQAAQLREQDQRKDEFLATLAHELRNPLAPIRTGLEVMQQVSGSLPTTQRAQGIMERQLGHMVRLIDDLLDVSRISRGKVELRRERLSIQAVLTHALEASRPVIEAAGHSFAVQMPASPLWIDGDLTRLAQVVSNLLHNAAKYTPQGGHVELSAASEGGEIVVRVTDSGSGIAAEMLPRVFDLFTQVDRTLHRAQGGLGIGLSLAHQLIELHGGRVEAASPGLGQGSTFTIRLPIAAPPAALDVPTMADPSASRQRRRILVVDDNEDAAEMMVMVLDRQGHETRLAFSGPEALALIPDFRPEVVFLDIGMPGMDGYEVARRLRADPSLTPTTLVALTGWGGEADKRKSREAGFDTHLTKPVDASAIETVLGHL